MAEEHPRSGSDVTEQQSPEIEAPTQGAPLDAPASPEQAERAEHLPARSFHEVLADELHAVQTSRGLRGQPQVEIDEELSPIQAAHEAHLMGVSFSGGGIRSATFNLGVLQALARLGVLPRLDYLSVNSGGGYIGGWFGAWVRRQGLEKVAAELTGDACRSEEDGSVQASPEPPTPKEPAGFGREQPGAAREGQDVEAPPVRFLRRFSNYLTPKVGAFSADTWTMVATYLRNLLLNQTILVLALGAILLSPRLLLLLSKFFRGFIPDQGPPSTLLYSLLGVAVVFLAIGLGAILANLARMGTVKKQEERAQEDSGRRLDDAPFYARQSGVQLLVVVPLFAAAWLAAQWLWFAKAGALADYTVYGSQQPAPSDPGLSLGLWLGRHWGVWDRVMSHFNGGTGRTLSMAGEILTWATLAATLYLLAWLVAALVLTVVGQLRGASARNGEGQSKRMWIAVVVASPFAGAVGGALIWVLTLISHKLEGLFEAADYAQPWHLLHVNVWKAPAIVLVFVLTAFFHTGLMGRAFPERLRQWWSRLGAWMLIYGLTWFGLFGIAIYGPILLVVLGSLVVGALSAGWLGSTVTGVLVGRSVEEDEEGGMAAGAEAGLGHKLRRIVVAVAPQVFILGLLALVALGLHGILSPPIGTSETPGAPGLRPECGFFWPPDAVVADNVREVVDCHSERLYEGTTPGATTILLLVLALASIGLSARVDVNEFSMHLFYRNRLIRAYLGASNPHRRPQPFTGFDPEDDVALGDLSPFKGYDGPYPIHNATLNLVAGKELAWQERKGTAWAFTPLASGFDVYGGRRTKRLDRDGYRPTSGYLQTDRGLTVGTAMGISGAAASPNMGAASTPAMAFLLTLFNVRLGWWLGNPRHRKAWPEMGPRIGLFSLVAELFGHTDETSRYVYLSDGGHFENLALYELIRRRCRFILATDAGADPDLAFADLGNAVRKCCTDFGIEIDIDPAQIRRDPGTGLSRWHCAVGTIRYDKVDPGAAPGILVYLKASLTGDEPMDSQAYATDHPEFPHQSTADQWFSESQFESYRKLGEHVTRRVLEAAADSPGGISREALFVRLSEAWFRPNGTPEGVFSRLSSTLDEMMERLRTDQALGFLVPQIYPEWPVLSANVPDAPSARMWLPETYEELVAGFFFCRALLQLMEDCYLDLALDTELDHPDNRGWLNLFKHWSWAGMVRATWAVTASSFGARFQIFCQRRLDLTVGAVRVRSHALPDGAGAGLDELLESLSADGRLNFLERDLVHEFAERNPGTDRLLILRLAVREPVAGPEEADAAELELTFGFALAAGKDLVYLRVQDHLRKMGLARRALRQMVHARVVDRVLPVRKADLPAWSQNTPGEAAIHALRHLFRSVRFEQEERDLLA